MTSMLHVTSLSSSATRAPPPDVESRSRRLRHLGCPEMETTIPNEDERKETIR
jgi:hypothetical protein